jgi:hypothetical protein
MKIELWIEGFQIQGDEGKAYRLDTYEADNLEQAVEIHNQQSSMLIEKKQGIFVFWGCRVFDNEADARKSFG